MPIYKIKGKQKDGLQAYNVTINYTDDAGKKRQIKRTVYGLTAAKDAEAKLLQDVKSGGVDSSISLNQFFRIYQKHRALSIRPQTLSNRVANYNNYVAPFLGEYKLNKINTKILNRWKLQLSQNDKLKISTLNKFIGELKTVFSFAVKNDYLKSNPVQKIEKFKDLSPMPQSEKMHFYTPAQFKIFINQFKKDTPANCDAYTFFMIAYYTGARRGEILALRWDDIQGNILKISKSALVNPDGSMNLNAPTKNTYSNRKIALPAVLLDALNEHRTRQQEAFPGWKSSGLILGYSRPNTISFYTYAKDKAATAAGLPIIRIHDFRHSHASLLINNNINILEVAHRLGHASTTQTLQVYAHLFPNDENKVVKLLDSI